MNNTNLPLQPTPNATPSATAFFEAYLAAPVVLVLYLGWKLYTRDWRLFVPIAEMDLKSGLVLHNPADDSEDDLPQNQPLYKRILRAFF